MKLTTSSCRTTVSRLHRQSGVVLVIMMIVLVAMTLASLSLVRSTDTANLIAGNMSFQQAAVHSADTGIETAATWLAGAGVLALQGDDETNGYAAGGLGVAPNLAASPPQSWDAYWVQALDSRAVKSTTPDAAGNTVSYVIDRLCQFPGSPTGGASCVSSPSVAVVTGSGEEAGQKQLNAPSVVYYRITVRVDGPRNSVSYVQSVVAI